MPYNYYVIVLTDVRKTAIVRDLFITLVARVPGSVTSCVSSGLESLKTDHQMLSVILPCPEMLVSLLR